MTIGSKEERPPFLDYVEDAGRFEKQLMKGITGLLDGGFGLGKLGIGLRVLMTAAECSNPLGWGLLGATLAVQGLNAMQRGGGQVGQACSGDLHGHSEGFVEQCLPDSVKPLYHGAEVATDFVALPRGSGRLATMLGGEEKLAKYSTPSMRMNLQFFAERPRTVNRNGMSYPQIRDLRTGKNVHFPEGKLEVIPLSERVEWNNYTRRDFIKEWYDRGFPTPEGGWAEYDIHHIRPREYGGNNSFENLVPLKRTTEHLEFNRFWAGYDK